MNWFDKLKQKLGVRGKRTGDQAAEHAGKLSRRGLLLGAAAAPVALAAAQGLEGEYLPPPASEAVVPRRAPIRYQARWREPSTMTFTVTMMQPLDGRQFLPEGGDDAKR